MDMPFSEIDNAELDELFPKPYFPEDYEVGYDADGNEWVHARGVWYPCVEDQDEDIDDQGPLNYPLYDYEDPRDLD